MTDTMLSREFWRSQPHLFVPAEWGRDYCRCCLDPEGTAIHTDATDSATHPGNCTGYRVARATETLFGITGWNADGSSCSFGARPTYEAALGFIDFIRKGGDPEGRTYEHFQIEERTYFTACDTNVAVVA